MERGDDQIGHGPRPLQSEVEVGYPRQEVGVCVEEGRAARLDGGQVLQCTQQQQKDPSNPSLKEEFFTHDWYMSVYPQHKTIVRLDV